MADTGFCPACGRLISYRFPVHDCKPTKLYKQSLKKLKWYKNRNWSKKDLIKSNFFPKEFIEVNF